MSSLNSEALILIISTIPVEYIEAKKKEGFESVVFVPEFLREGKAFFDNLYSSRITIGEKRLKNNIHVDGVSHTFGQAKS